MRRALHRWHPILRYAVACIASLAFWIFFLTAATPMTPARVFYGLVAFALAGFVGMLI